MFSKLLIANRGEIAVRIARTARRMGVQTVAVCSDVDADAVHVAACDEAVHIGPAAPSESYLVIDKIIDAAKRTGAQAIHPGYGFLSENAAFAKACDKAGIAFVGPGVEAIRIMGSKSLSKDLMTRSGVPVAPGYQGEEQSLKTFKAEAERIGYPVLLKASAGGGGKGMRLVEEASELKEALASAKREAKSAFGDDRFLIEKFIGRPRHVEVQVFGDTHGNIVHLFERDCSLQRRHQKVIEEAPAPDLSPKVRARLHEAAVNAARSVNYVGAGTVEFLFDPSADEADSVYFMEMNTRLQVEHPVTECVTGLDLVEWQLRVAFGEELPLSQEEITCTGHAFEARLYAEDADAGFLPSTGHISRMVLPSGEGMRMDAGVAEGGDVTPHYDPMIAKIITSAETRDGALSRLRQALSGVRVSGPETNARFLHALAAHPAFQAIELDTHFIERHDDALFAHPELSSAPIIAACLFLLAEEADESASSEGGDPWTSLGGWRLTTPSKRTFWLRDGETAINVVKTDADGDTVFVINDERITAHGQATAAGDVRLTVDGQALDAFVARTKTGLRVWLGAERFDLAVVDPLSGPDSSGLAAGSLAAPMPGVVTALSCKPGDKASAGDTLVVMEAMKMEHALHAPSDGVVKAYRFQVGDQVGEGDLLVEFEADEAE